MSRWVLYSSGQRYIEKPFKDEQELERLIIENSNMFFGSRTFFLDLKKKVEAKALGISVPDGLLIDFRDPENPEFYLVEIELASHDFYKHIFPQITKFLAFFKNPKSRTELIEKLFTVINSDQELKHRFSQLLGTKEIYKSIKDIVENSQNILIILDEHMPELREVSEVYIDTWDKMVRILVVKRYQAGDSTIIAMNPDFEELGLEQPPEDEDTERDGYTETYHLEGVEPKIVASYERIKQEIQQLDPQIRINPQKYYISLRRDKNFAYIKFRKKRMHIILTMPYEEGRKIINKHRLSSLSEGVKKFYGADCCMITVEDDKNMEEIIQALKKAYQLHLNPSE